MIIRPSISSDLPAMIDLLRASLGEGLIPKSETYFKWKHEQNPFGPSFILLAEEEHKIIGLRAFMRWRWVCGKDSVESVRAVDTATDPNHQGKGIFKKLTLQAVETCKESGIALVFNSPNKHSLPGYLKMGWHITGKMPLHFAPGSWFPAKYMPAGIEQLLEQYSCNQAFGLLDDGWSVPPSAEYFHTPISKSYLVWRYRDCPIVQYGAIVEAGQFGFIFRIKPMKGFSELRICELWTEQPEAKALARKAYRSLLKRLRPLLVSCAPSPLFDNGKSRLSMPGPFKKGPVTTLRPLAMDNLNNFEAFKQWRPSIGAMELF